MKAALAIKLGPERFPTISGTMFACLGALLDDKMSEPQLASIVATSDGWRIGRDEGDAGFNETIGAFEAFERNALGMADAAGDLTKEEYAFLPLLLERVENGEETSSGKTTINLDRKSVV